MYYGKKILAIVPARGGSKGIRLKNLKKINGKSLIEHVSEVIKKFKKIDYSVVSTDHPKIKKEAISTGLFQIVDRTKYLSGDKVSDFQVLSHAIKSLQYKKLFFDIVLMLQPTSVLRDAKHIEKALNLIVKKKFDFVWSVSEVDLKYHPLKQLITNKNKINFYNIAGKNIIARQQLKKTYIRNGAVYAFKTKVLLKQKKILNKNTGYFIIKSKQISIDTKKDLETAELYLKKNK